MASQESVGDTTSDLLREISQDISKTIENHLDRSETDEKTSKGPQTRKTSKGGVSGDMENSLKTIISEVIRSLQPVLVDCVSIAVSKAVSSLSKQVVETVKSQYEESGVIADLKNQIKLQTYQLDRMEQYTRRENIRITGIPYEDGEDTTEKVIKTAREIGVTLTREDVSVSHRVGRTNQEAQRPIIARLSRREKKVELMKNKKKLGRGLYMDEDLTRTRNRMLYEIRKHPQTTKTWTIDGKIFAVISDEGEESRKVFETPDDLYKLGWNETKVQLFLKGI